MIVLALLALGSSAGIAGDLEEVLADHYEAMGGLEAIKGIKSVEMKGKAIVQGGMELPFVIRSIKPNKSRMDITIQGSKMVMAKNDEDLWGINPLMGSNDPMDLPESQQDNVKNQADLEGPLVNWKEKGHQLELMGEEDVQGSMSYKIKITREDGEVIFTYLDKETLAPLKSSSIQTDMMGSESEVHTYFTNYKEVGGTYMPFSMKMTSAEGVVQMEVVFDTINANVEIPADYFERPAKAEQEDGQ